MIQFNLLPEVKIEYMKVNHLKRLIIGGSLVAGVLCALVFAALYINVSYVQTRHIDNLTEDISKDFNKISSQDDVNKILTVQRQLNSLTKLHEQNPSASRVQRYLRQLTPKAVSIDTASISFSDATIKLSGTTDSLATVNKFADTLKFTTFKVGEEPTEKKAFSEVVLTSFGVTPEGATYQISFKFDPQIFDNTVDVQITTPNIISTRSNIEKPTGLFQPQPTKKEDKADNPLL